MSGHLECRCYGRDFTTDEMAVLRALIAETPPLNRRRISLELCRRIGWYKPDGGLWGHDGARHHAGHAQGRADHPAQTPAQAQPRWADHLRTRYRAADRAVARDPRRGAPAAPVHRARGHAPVCRQLPADWTARYHTTPVLIETFVETPRFTGALYKASGWTRVGLTQGRGRYDRHKQYGKPKKAIWLRPLARHWQRTLNR